MKKATVNTPRGSFRSALLAFALLLLGVSLACFVWVRKEQGQYALNRQLIEALKKGDTKEALALVNAGADPNTHRDPSCAPSLLELTYQLVHHRQSDSYQGPTALMMACGAASVETMFVRPYRPLTQTDYQLTQTMLLHGGNVNAKDEEGLTVLYYAIWLESKNSVKQMLDCGADPDVLSLRCGTPIEQAKGRHRPDIVALLRKYSKHP